MRKLCVEWSAQRRSQPDVETPESRLKQQATIHYQLGLSIQSPYISSL
jgi:hypothetical protein